MLFSDVKIVPFLGKQSVLPEDTIEMPAKEVQGWDSFLSSYIPNDKYPRENAVHCFLVPHSSPRPAGAATTLRITLLCLSLLYLSPPGLGPFLSIAVLLAKRDKASVPPFQYSPFRQGEK